MTGDFSAGPSALGFFYQTRYALLILLRNNSDFEMSLESLDDIVFEQEGSPVELLQTKHHINSTASLTDASSDLWKTLRVWSTAISQGHIQPEEVMFTLVTTARAPDNSAARKLCPEVSQGRNVNSALKILRDTAKTSRSVTNRPAYDAFSSLSDSQQRRLASSIYILDSSPNILDTRDQILSELRVATRPLFLEPVYERLEGWWFNRVVRHLSSDSPGIIMYRELLAQINDIQEQFHQDNLPIDFFDAVAPKEDELSENERLFIEQLRLVSVGAPRIRRAINDYYRAYQQRSKWVREDLLLVGELDSYERRLIDAWEERFEIMREDLGDEATEDEMKVEGRAFYNWLSRQEISIRSRCTEAYVIRGSFHILSNKLRIGWHIDFLNRLQHLLLKAAKGK